MEKIAGDTVKFIFKIPRAYREWIREHKVASRQFDSEAAYLRYLVRQDIQRSGPLPGISPRPLRKKRAAAGVGRADRPNATNESAPPPGA